MNQAAFDAVLKAAGHEVNVHARRLYLCHASDASLAEVNRLAARVLARGAQFGQEPGVTQVLFDRDGDAACHGPKVNHWLFRKGVPIGASSRTTEALWKLIEAEALRVPDLLDLPATLAGRTVSFSLPEGGGAPFEALQDARRRLDAARSLATEAMSLNPTSGELGEGNARNLQDLARRVLG